MRSFILSLALLSRLRCERVDFSEVQVEYDIFDVFEAVVTVELGEANSCSGEDWSGRLLGIEDDEDIFLVFDGVGDTSF